MGKVIHFFTSRLFSYFRLCIHVTKFEKFINFMINRFISDIEAVCRQWMADGPKNLLVCLALLYYQMCYVNETFATIRSNRNVTDILHC